MSATDTQFNGTTVSFSGTAIGGILSVTASGRCPPVPTTGATAADGSAQTTTLFNAGLPDLTTTVTVVGNSSLAKGSTGALSVEWNDGGTFGSMTKGRLMKKPTMAGSKNNPNITTLVFKWSK